MHDRRNVIYFLPAILWLGIIFFLSGQTGEQTASLSLSIARWLARFFPGASEAGLHMWLRKLAHIGVYFVEGALLFPALRRTLRGAGKGFAATLVLCALIAAADEAHKALIPGRHCSWDEAGLNVLGAFLGAGAVLIFVALKVRRRKRRNRQDRYGGGFADDREELCNRYGATAPEGKKVQGRKGK